MSRLDELRTEERTVGGDHPNISGLNRIGGLLDLIADTRPRSVLEIGSNRGVSTECFLISAARVVSVDPWDSNDTVYQEFMRRVGGYSNLEIVRGKSPDALERFGENEFDLVYIDADHGEGAVIADIKAARRISSMWLSGHDFEDRTGVPAAVRKTLGEPDRVYADTSWLIRNERHAQPMAAEAV